MMAFGDEDRELRKKKEETPKTSTDLKPGDPGYREALEAAVEYIFMKQEAKAPR